MRIQKYCGVSITLAQGRMLQQVAVVQSANAEVLEFARALGVDGIVELARVRFHELQHAAR